MTVLAKPIPAQTSRNVESQTAIRRATAAAALLAISLWLGGLVALGAIAAPVVFTVVPHPSSADAMTIVFQRFDLLAMACAAVVLGTEAARAMVRRAAGRVSGRLDRWRASLSALAAAAAVFEGTRVSPRIAALHAAGAIRGMGSAGQELARLHDVAEWCGKTELAVLAAVIVLHVFALTSPGPERGQAHAQPPRAR